MVKASYIVSVQIAMALIIIDVSNTNRSFVFPSL